MTSLIFNFSCCSQNRPYGGVVHVSANPTQPQGRVLREVQSISVNPGQPRRLGEVQLEPKHDVESITLDVEKILQNSLSCSDCVICLDSFDVVKNDHDVNNGCVKVLEQCEHRFHSFCIQRWLRKHQTSPLCRICISIS